MSELTVSDAVRLKQLETTITKGSKAFIEVGLALAEIRDSKLYRVHFSTFEKYCEAKWNWSKQHVYRLIECAPVAESNPRVTNYKQASELAKVDPAKRDEVIEAASEQAATEGRPMTSQDIADAATVDVESEVVDEPETPVTTSPAPAKTQSGEHVWTIEKFRTAIETIRSEFMDEWGDRDDFLRLGSRFMRGEAVKLDKRITLIRKKKQTPKEGQI